MHAYDEFLLHEAEAHFRGLFMHLTKCNTSEKLTAWGKTHSSGDILKVAKQMLVERASSAALELDKSNDEIRHITIMHQRELLLYTSVRRAYKYDDIDRIEALLSELLLYFAGAGNSNFAQEVFEFLQLTTHECTPEIRCVQSYAFGGSFSNSIFRKVILQCGLVVNILGHEDSFFPIDQLHEHNNAGIRVSSFLVS